MKNIEETDIEEELKQKFKELVENQDFKELISRAYSHILQKEINEDYLRRQVPEELLDNLPELLEHLDRLKERAKENLKNQYSESLLPEDLESVEKHIEEQIEKTKEFFSKGETLADDILEKELDSLAEELGGKKEEGEERRDLESEIESYLKYLSETEGPLREYINRLSKGFLFTDFENLTLLSLERQIKTLGFDRTLRGLLDFVGGLLSINEGRALTPLEVLNRVKDLLSRDPDGLTKELLDFCVAHGFSASQYKDSHFSYEELKNTIEGIKTDCQTRLGAIGFMLQNFLPKYENAITHSFLKTTNPLSLQITNMLLNNLKNKTGELFEFVKSDVRSHFLRNLLEAKYELEQEKRLALEKEEEFLKQKEDELSKNFEVPEELKSGDEEGSSFRTVLDQLIKYAPTREVYKGEETSLSPIAASLILETIKPNGLVNSEDANVAFNGMLYQAASYLDAVAKQNFEHIKRRFSLEGKNFDYTLILNAIKYLLEEKMVHCEENSDCNSIVKNRILDRIKEALIEFNFLPLDAKSIPPNIEKDEEGNIKYLDHTEDDHIYPTRISNFFESLKKLSGYLIAYSMLENGVYVSELETAVNNFHKSLPDDTTFGTEDGLSFIDSNLSWFLAPPVEGERHRVVEFLDYLKDIFQRKTGEEVLEEVFKIELPASVPFVLGAMKFIEGVVRPVSEIEEYSPGLIREEFNKVFDYEEFGDYLDRIYKILLTQYPSHLKPGELTDDIPLSVTENSSSSISSITQQREDSEQPEEEKIEKVSISDLEENLLNDRDFIEQFLDLSEENEEHEYKINDDKTIIFYRDENFGPSVRLVYRGESLKEVPLSEFSNELPLLQQIDELYEKILAPPEEVMEREVERLSRALNKKIKPSKRAKTKERLKQKQKIQEVPTPTEDKEEVPEEPTDIKEEFEEKEPIQETISEPEETKTPSEPEEIKAPEKKTQKKQKTKPQKETSKKKTKRPEEPVEEIQEETLVPPAVEEEHKERIEQISEEKDEEHLKEIELAKNNTVELQDYLPTLKRLFSPDVIRQLSDFLSKGIIGEISEEQARDVKTFISLGIFSPENKEFFKFISIALKEYLPEISQYIEQYEREIQEDKDFSKFAQKITENALKTLSKSEEEKLISLAKKLASSKNPVASSVARRFLETRERSFFSKKTIFNKNKRETLSRLKDSIKAFIESGEDTFSPISGIEVANLLGSLSLNIEKDGELYVLPVTDFDEEINEDTLENLTYMIAALEDESVRSYVPLLNQVILSDGDEEFSVFNIVFGKRRLSDGFVYFIENPFEEKTYLYSSAQEFLLDSFYYLYSPEENIEQRSESVSSQIEEDKEEVEEKTEKEPQEETTEKKKAPQKGSAKKEKGTQKKQSEKSPKEKKQKTKPRGKIKTEIAEATINEQGTIQVKVVDENLISGEKETSVLENVAPDEIRKHRINTTLRKLGIPEIKVRNDNELFALGKYYEQVITKPKESIEEERRLYFVAEYEDLLDAILSFKYQETKDSPTIQKTAKEVIDSYNPEKFKKSLLNSMMPKLLAVYDIELESLEAAIQELQIPSDIGRYKHNINPRNLKASFVEDIEEEVTRFLRNLGITDASRSFIQGEILRALLT